MSDFTLKDGREITFDFYQMSYGQWKGIFDKSETEDQSDATIARVCGMSLEDFKKLSFPDYKRLLVKFFERARDPIADPNA